MTADTLPALFPVAARIAGAGVVLTGLELVPVAREINRWRRSPGRPATGVAASVLLSAVGVTLVAWPAWAVTGGAVLAAALLAWLVLTYDPIGDGADVMLVIVLAGLGGLNLMPTPWLRTLMWWLLAGHVCLAYWWSGVAKLRVPAWRAGRQIALVLNSPQYGSAALAWQFLHRPWLGRAAAWTVIPLELSAPVFLAVGGVPLAVWACCAVAMHLGIAVMMGLGRFAWAFGAGLCAMLAARGTL